MSDTNTKPLDYFARLHAAFIRAQCADGEAQTRTFAFGSSTLRLKFASLALVEHFTRALAHLEVSSGKASENVSEELSARHDKSLTICLLDSATTATPLPTPPWNLDDQLGNGAIRGYNTPRLRTAYFADTETLQMLDVERGIGFYWTQDARRIPYWERGAPLRATLGWWAASRGTQLAHAAGIGTREGGVLLAGKSGSGKSNTALACLSSPLSYAGDDYCLLALESAPRVYSLYNSAKINHADLPRYTQLAAHASNQGQLDKEKALIFLHEQCPEKIIREFPLQAVLLPRVTFAKRTTLAPLSAAQALLGLAPSTILQQPAPNAASLDQLTELVKRVPCYRLELGTCREEIAGTILQLLEKKG